MPPKLSPSIQGLIETAMQEDDETTATQLQSILAAHNDQGFIQDFQFVGGGGGGGGEMLCVG